VVFRQPEAIKHAGGQHLDDTELNVVLIQVIST